MLSAVDIFDSKLTGVRAIMQSQIAKLLGPHRAHLGPVGPRWTPCWPHEPCYQGHCASESTLMNICRHIPVIGNHRELQMWANQRKAIQMWNVVGIGVQYMKYGHNSLYRVCAIWQLGRFYPYQSRLLHKHPSVSEVTSASYGPKHHRHSE